MTIHLTIENVDKYELVDKDISGLPYLKVLRKDDAVPLLYDSQFNLSEPLTRKKHQSDSLPVVTQLMRKLTEAKYSVRQNESNLQEYVKIKQAAAFSLYETGNPNSEDSMFKTGTNIITKVLEIKTKKPCVKLCNKKVIVIVNIENENTEPIDNIHILFHGLQKKSTEYTTKIYEETSYSPYWREKDFHSIKSNEECSIIGIIEMKELKYSVSKIEFEAVLSYMKQGKSYVLPLDDVSISAIDTMGENFDILQSSEEDKYKVLAILATSEKTDINLRHIDHKENPINILEAISNHLDIERLGNLKNVLIHKKSLNHILYGLTLIFLEETNLSACVTVQIYSRSPAQVLAFIHYLYDGVPYRIMATLPNHIVTSKSEDLSHLDSEKIDNPQIDYTSYATTIINQSKIMLQYLDECIVKMNENTSPEVQSKIGHQIQILSMGLPEFLKFRNKVLQEASNGIQGLKLKEKIDTLSVDMMDES
ncbi:unnamed protein product [Leptosia nina]|uniref:C2 domain-containing protein n=1 Tax=Leptosia nina TaxID=320188 RepID=A0AAV1JQ72_9NEOP